MPRSASAASRRTQRGAGIPFRDVKRRGQFRRNKLVPPSQKPADNYGNIFTRASAGTPPCRRPPQRPAEKHLPGQFQSCNRGARRVSRPFSGPKSCKTTRRAPQKHIKPCLVLRKRQTCVTKRRYVQKMKTTEDPWKTARPLPFKIPPFPNVGPVQQPGRLSHVQYIPQNPINQQVYKI
jgi:hypothetical protein